MTEPLQVGQFAIVDHEPVERGDQPTFTEITLDVRGDEHSTMSGSLRTY
jgi:hypothetical protein